MAAAGVRQRWIGKDGRTAFVRCPSPFYLTICSVFLFALAVLSPIVLAPCAALPTPRSSSFLLWSSARVPPFPPLPLFPRRLMLEASRGAAAAPLGDAGGAPSGRLSFPIAQSDPLGAFNEQGPPREGTQRDGATHVISSTKTSLHLPLPCVCVVRHEQHHKPVVHRRSFVWRRTTSGALAVVGAHHWVPSDTDVALSMSAHRW